MAQSNHSIPATDGAVGETFDSIWSIALNELYGCAECVEPAAVIVVGYDALHAGITPLCLGCYEDSPFSKQPIHRTLPPQ